MSLALSFRPRLRHTEYDIRRRTEGSIRFDRPDSEASSSFPDPVVAAAVHVVPVFSSVAVTVAVLQLDLCFCPLLGLSM